MKIMTNNTEAAKQKKVPRKIWQRQFLWNFTH